MKQRGDGVLGRERTIEVDYALHEYALEGHDGQVAWRNRCDKVPSRPRR